MSIENKIKEELLNYEIKTTSDDILNRLPSKQKSKKFNIFIPFAVSFAVLAIGIFSIVNMVNDKDKLYIKNQALLSDDTILSNAALELYYGGSMYEENVSLLVYGEYEDDEFEDAVEKYKDISDMVDDLYSKNENGIISYYENTSFKYNDKKYSYKLTVDDYVLYSKEDFTKSSSTNVILEFNNKFLSGNIEVLPDSNDVILSYEINEENIKITKNHNDKNISFNYDVTNDFDNKFKSHILEMEFNEENDMMLKYSFKDEGPGFEMEIRMDNGKHNIDFYDHEHENKVQMEHDKNEGKDHFAPRSEKK